MLDFFKKKVSAVNSDIEAFASKLNSITKKALSVAFKTAGNSDLDAIKVIFVTTLLSSLEANSSGTYSSEQNALIAKTLVSGFDEIANSTANAIEPTTTNTTSTTK